MVKPGRSHAAVTANTTLTKATLRVADKLGINNRTLAAIIGVSEPSVSRMRRGDFKLEQGQKSFELGVLLVRLYRSLDAIVGGDERIAQAWLRNENIALGSTPLSLVQTIPGLINVIQYLDGRRAPI